MYQVGANYCSHVCWPYLHDLRDATVYLFIYSLSAELDAGSSADAFFDRL
jgi:hypothetical protein